MISHAEYMELLAASAGPAVLGVMASIVRHARYGWKGVRHFVAGILTSVFTSVITGLLLDMYDLPASVVMAIVGMSAYSGGTLLDAILWRADKEIRTAKLPGVHSVKEENCNAEN